MAVIGGAKKLAGMHARVIAARALLLHALGTASAVQQRTSSALARVMATLKRLGLRQKPRCASASAPLLPGAGAFGKDSGRDSTCAGKQQYVCSRGGAY